MKKKILGGLLVVAIATIASFNMGMNTQEGQMSALMLANIEALAQNEGTAVGTCYMSGSNGEHEMYTQCRSSTTEGMIYSCPSGKSYGQKGVSSECAK